MDIRKSEICNNTLYIALVGAILLAVGKTSLSDTKMTADVFIDAYKLGPEATSEKVKSAIAALEKTLPDCRDNYLSFRIKYETGVLYFKAHMMAESKSTFLQIASDSNCPEIIKICSFNMIAQISRLAKENDDALNAFGQVAYLLEQKQLVDKSKAVYPALAKLWCSALINRAEIYEASQNYIASINEYVHLLHTPGRNGKGDAMSQYGALVSDRLSQLYLRQGNLNEYIKRAELLTADYPGYYRTPIIKLEIECVKSLKSVPADFEFVDGSLAAPAYLIAYINDSRNKTLGQQISDKLDMFCREYPNTYGGILLLYHYAWLLDALDEKDKAAEIFARISSIETGQTDYGSGDKTIMKTIQIYAKIQYAVMLGEKGDYLNALQTLDELRTHHDKSHISELAESIGKSMETLKRELYKNEKK